MNFHHLPVLATALANVALITPALAQAQTTPPNAESTDSNVIVLGRYQVAAEKDKLSSSADLLTSVTIAGSDQLEFESVDYSLELLNKIPGLTLTDFNQGIITADVSMRGFNGEGSSPHLRLVVDGIPHNLNNGYNDLGAIFSLEIERIEAIKGNLDPRFGLNAIAGALNVHTHQIFDGQKIKILAGDHGTLDTQALAGFRHGGFSQTYYAGYRESDGYRDHASLEKHSFAGKWFYTAPADKWRIGLSARTHEFDAEAPGYLSLAESRVTPRASPTFSNTDGGKQTNDQFSLHAEASPTDTFAFSARAYNHDVRRNRFVRFTAAGSQQERIEDETHRGLILQSRLTFHPGFPLLLDTGAEYHKQDALNQRFATVARVRSSTTRNHRYLLENTGGFLSADAQPLKWLRIVAALRADSYDGDFRNFANSVLTPILDYGTLWQPKLSVSVSPWQHTRFYASYGRSHQIGAGSAAYGTSSLDASKNDGYELGLHTTPHRDLTLRLALWRQTATDEVRLKPDNSGDSENIGETRRQGLDLEASWRFHQRLTLWAAYTLQKGELTNPGLRPADAALLGNEIDHIPDFSVKTGLDADLTKTLTASLSILGQGDYHLRTTNADGRFGDYLLTNVDLRYRWKNATFGLHVKNLFDEYYEYVWHDGVQSLHSPGDSRTFLGSVSYEF